MSFVPKLEVLPQAQRDLWPDLRQVPGRFVLYGGTALAMRLGHRTSVDFDFFADAPLDPDEVLRTIPFLDSCIVRQKAANTLTVAVQRCAEVKLSFFGINLRRVGDPEKTSDDVVRVASLRDVAACKMAVIQTRPESKDYLDIFALLKSGMRLETMLGAAQAVYGSRFNPLISMKALSWFGDGDLDSLPENVKRELRESVSKVTDTENLEPLPGGVVPAEG